MRGYGSTADDADGPSSSSSSYATPLQHHEHGGFPFASLRRNESAGGATAHTSESEPLLGEQLLLGEEESTTAGGTARNAVFLPPTDCADASTIEKVGSDRDDDLPGDPSTGTTTPRQSGSLRKRSSLSQQRGGGSNANDPHIGLSVVTNVLDSLAYSRDPDESTLLTSDFTKRNLSGNLSTLDEEGGGTGRRRGLLRRFFSTGEGGASEPPVMLVCLGLAVGVALCSVSLFAFVEYGRHQDAVSDGEGNVNPSSSEGTWHGVPFEKIGRESFGDPVSDIFDVGLFHPSLLYGGRREDGGRRRRLASGDGAPAPKPFLKVPFPTGAFWTNLVLLSKNKQHAKDQYSYPIVAYPYSYQWSPRGKLQASYSASHRTLRPRSIQDGFLPDVTIGSAEEIRKRHVVRFDPLSVTLRFYASNSDDGGGGSSGGGGDGSWETYLVQGSPYITAKYSGLSPELTALSDFEDIACPPVSEGSDPGQFHQSEQQLQQVEGEDSNWSNRQRRRRTKDSSTSAPAATTGKKLGICAVATGSSTRRKIVTGVQFVATTKEGLTWLVFASEPITLEFNLAGSRRTISSGEKYGGVIRLALVPPPSSATAASETTGKTKSIDFEKLASSPGVKRLIYHAGAYPTGGTVSWNFRSGVRAPLATSSHPNTYLNGKSHARTMTLEHVHARGQSRRSAAEAPKENNIGRVTFAFDAKHTTLSSPNADVPLLMLSLPHHVAFISSAEQLLLHQKDFDLIYECIKGRMVPVVGNTWSYEEELTFVGFGDESPPAKANVARHSASSSSGGGDAMSRRSAAGESTAISTLDQSIRDLLLQTVESDLTVNLPALSGGAYGFGKQIARMAQLAHIVEVVDAVNVREVDALVDRIKNAKNDTSTSSTSESAARSFSGSTTSATGGSSTARRGYALLEKYLTTWLAGDDGGREKHLAYDAQLGGVLSKEGMSDINADFGNARYNDHHFHYGYVLYAAAVLGRAEPKFVAQYGPFVDALFYDVAHAGGGGDKIFFPTARHKSWFDGHSFASGLFPFADGKSQESSSEAVNCYYGAYLWARVRWGGGSDGGRKMVDHARLLLATEVTGARMYWHMTPVTQGSGRIGRSANATTAASLVPVPYNPSFRENYMVGNLGMTDVTCTTWFGQENIYVHLINFMPVTAMTSDLFDKGYVKGERSVLNDNHDSAEYAWRGYSICNEAILDPNSAWIEAQNLISGQLDPGLSKSQVLFWTSTREGFSPGTKAEVSSAGNGDPQMLDDDAPSSNARNSDSATTNAKSAVNGGKANSLASCTSHEKCVAENLTGSCCPTNEGVFLRCCT